MNDTKLSGQVAKCQILWPRNLLLCLLLAATLLLTGCVDAFSPEFWLPKEAPRVTTKQLDNVAYDGESPYAVVNDDQPDFEESDYTTDSYEYYGGLDVLGRCTVVEACIGKELMPTEEREDIGHIKPTGWHSANYDIVDGGSLYNRCHLIAFQLTGENDNERNLITGTRYMNVEGMLPFEELVGEYIRETGNHVLYRVTPYFTGNNLVADGVQMEALSMEDGGEGICFNVFVYNVQPGIGIDYETGDHWLEENDSSSEEQTAENRENARQFILNTNSKKVHLTTCSGVSDIKKRNKQEFFGTIEELNKQGYEPCGRCNPF